LIFIHIFLLKIQVIPQKTPLNMGDLAGFLKQHQTCQIRPAPISFYPRSQTVRGNSDPADAHAVSTDFMAVAAGTCGVLKAQVFPVSVIIIQPAAKLPTDYHEFTIYHDSI
jgi:hypothetical protein